MPCKKCVYREDDSTPTNFASLYYIRIILSCRYLMVDKESLRALVSPPRLPALCSGFHAPA